MTDPLDLDLTGASAVGVPPRAPSQHMPQPERPAAQPQFAGTELAKSVHSAPTRPAARSSLAKTAPRTDKPTGFQRALGAFRAVLPVVLPLLEGNIASAASNLLSPRSQHPVDLGPVESAVGKMKAEQRTLRDQVWEQKSFLQRLENELAAVKTTTEQNAEDLRELAEHLLVARKRMSRFTWIIVALLALSLAFNVLVFVRMASILRM
jgi:hypothetical protein